MPVSKHRKLDRTDTISRRDLLKASGILSAGLAASSLLAGCSVATSGEGDSSSDAGDGQASADYKYGHITIPGKNGSLCNAPAYIAYDQGYFAEAGFDVELITSDGENNKIGLNNGTIPIVNGDFQFFPAIEQGVKTRVVDGLHYGCIKLGVLPDSPIQTAEDVRGKKIGVSEIGGTPYQAASMWLETNGIKTTGADAEVTFLPLDDANLEIEALKQGQIDVAALWDPVASIREKAGEIRVILDIGADAPFNDKYCCFLYGSATWIDEDQERAAALLAAYHKAQDWIAKNPADAAKVISEKQYSAITDLDLAAELLEKYRYPTYEYRASQTRSATDDVLYFAQELNELGYLSTDPQEFTDKAAQELDVRELDPAPAGIKGASYGTGSTGTGKSDEECCGGDGAGASSGSDASSEGSAHSDHETQSASFTQGGGR